MKYLPLYRLTCSGHESTEIHTDVNILSWTDCGTLYKAVTCVCQWIWTSRNAPCQAAADEQANQPNLRVSPPARYLGCYNATTGPWKALLTKPGRWNSSPNPKPVTWHDKRHFPGDSMGWCKSYSVRDWTVLMRSMSEAWATLTSQPAVTLLLCQKNQAELMTYRSIRWWTCVVLSY